MGGVNSKTNLRIYFQNGFEDGSLKRANQNFFRLYSIREEANGLITRNISWSVSNIHCLIQLELACRCFLELGYALDSSDHNLLWLASPFQGFCWFWFHRNGLGNQSVEEQPTRS